MILEPSVGLGAFGGLPTDPEHLVCHPVEAGLHRASGESDVGRFARLARALADRPPVDETLVERNGARGGREVERTSGGSTVRRNGYGADRQSTWGNG